jgi:hypothetical protein
MVLSLIITIQLLYYIKLETFNVIIYARLSKTHLYGSSVGPKITLPLYFTAITNVHFKNDLICSLGT